MTPRALYTCYPNFFRSCRMCWHSPLRTFNSTGLRNHGAYTDILPLDEVERRAIVHTPKVTGNNTFDAARALCIGRTTLYRKLTKYNLQH
ncbi:hypothetical protein F4Z99_12550 [Candidatus Poribacteria bacterium]|nr:hypothetical protein [Candidatus Poribacteria bacterium]MYA99709.1 hypothetical protein [Candidatus Poribacteria bacterium]